MRTKQEILNETLQGIPTPDDIMKAMQVYADEFAKHLIKWHVDNGLDESLNEDFDLHLTTFKRQNKL